MIRLSVAFLCCLGCGPAFGGMKTWDGKHEIDRIDVTIVYFVPRDRTPLPDWKERVDYFRRRIELFHRREFEGQSTLTTSRPDEPFVSELTTAELRKGDANAICFRTLREADRRLEFAQGKRTGFPILLVLSEINWRPLDDFYRLQPKDGKLVFEGNYSNSMHFPGAASGGARATYLADRGVGWGLVSADGWRVPYRGTDCVVYHEGCGHTVGLPHPQPGNNSVMSLGQYHGWISESWLDKDQKIRLGWEPKPPPADPQLELYSAFRALPEPRVPKPNEPVRLALDWPDGAKVESLRMRYQTSVASPWVEVPQIWNGDAPQFAAVGTFDRAAPVSYRCDAVMQDGSTAEIWGYFQVRANPRENPQPFVLSPDLIVDSEPAVAATDDAPSARDEIDLLKRSDPAKCWTAGEWSAEGDKLLSPKQFGARLELPYEPPEEYRLTVIAEPLDEPHALILGQRAGQNRFVALFNYTRDNVGLSAIENVDGQNVGNSTTYRGELFKQNRLSQVIVTVRRDSVRMSVDGRTIVDWKGKPERLSLSDYWKTPNDTALFIGAYDCRYRFHRITLTPISGEGKEIDSASVK